MKIKEVALKEIHWSLPTWNAGTQANDRLRQMLGSTLSAQFARCSVGGAFYVWNVDINGKWTPLTNAQPAEEMLARKAWDELKQEVRSRLNNDPDLAEKILTIPNEEYVFYQIDAAGQVKVLITGWGFTNFKRPVIGNQRVEVEDKGAHPISVAFAIDDEKVPGRDFFIVTPMKNVPHTTDGEGNFSLGKINADTTFEIIDAPTGRKFNILTDRTTTEYTFDVTERINVSIEASHDNQPISGETATIDYHGRTYELTLEAGRAAVALALHPGEVCTARFRDAMQQQTMNQAGHTFRFDSMTPPPPEPEPEPEPESELIPEPEPEPEPEKVRDISIQVIDRNMRPLAKSNITFKQGEKEMNQQLDALGTTWLAKDEFKTGEEMTARIMAPGRVLPPIPFTLDEGETQYVLQEIKPKGFADYLPEMLAVIGSVFGLVIAFFLGGGFIDIATKFLLSLI